MTLFSPFDARECCLCGSEADPTGEHRIKASSLREQFGRQVMVIVRDGDRPRFAQGANSDHFKFDAPMCATCNNTRTQAADLEWDCFRQAALACIARGDEPVRAFDLDRYQSTVTGNRAAYLDVFRYLAKLMANHLADVGAPRARRLGAFALGEADDCPIETAIVRDPTYAAHAGALGAHPYAAHGGLVLLGHNDTGTPTGFHTAVTLGPLQCAIVYRLRPDESAALSGDYPEFVARCRAAMAAAAASPVPRDLRIKLGLEAPDPMA